MEERLTLLGLRLPAVPRPVAAYVPAARAGDLVFVSGQLPMEEGRLRFKGRVGTELGLAEGQEAARLCALNALAALKSTVSLEAVARVVKLTGYVASAPDFEDQPQVVNGASQLLKEIFGPSGEHARAAVGVSALPLGAPVEIELIVQMKTEK